MERAVKRTGWIWYSFATDENEYVVPLPISKIGPIEVPVIKTQNDCKEFPEPKFESSLSPIN